MIQLEMLQTMQECHPCATVCPAKVSILIEPRNLFNQEFILFVPTFHKFLVLFYSREPSKFTFPFFLKDHISMNKYFSHFLNVIRIPSVLPASRYLAISPSTKTPHYPLAYKAKYFRHSGLNLRQQQMQHCRLQCADVSCIQL